MLPPAMLNLRMCRLMNETAPPDLRARLPCSRCNASCSWRTIFRPRAEVVHRALKGQSVQAAPNVTRRLAVTARVMPCGQVTVPAASSTVKSSGYIDDVRTKNAA